MSDNLTVERVDLQKKDKSELATIVAALGGKPASRATKAGLIDQILELSGVVAEQPQADEGGAEQSGTSSTESSSTSGTQAENATGGSRSSTIERESTDDAEPTGGRGRRRRGRSGQPPADWENDLGADSNARQGSGRGSGGPKADEASGPEQSNGSAKGDEARSGDGRKSDGGENADNKNTDNKNTDNKHDGGRNADNKNADATDDGEGANRRRRRRGRGRDRDDEQLPPLDPIRAAGYLDLREDGYGFLRVNGYLQSADDVYVPVKMARQFGLRKGDLVEGTARPANRNEKNPALQTITAINGADPELSPSRLRFEDLTPVYPFERLSLEMTEVPTASAARLVDLVAPIGKGQRSLIVAPPEAGAAELIKQVAVAIEANNPEVHLMVLQFDGRPEEVITIEQALEHGEVAAATFDAAPEDQVALADFTIERAKRMVEAGEDVVIIADGLTAIARAYSLGTPATGRTIAGVDASALHPTKRFFGAARKLEEAGSLTILATITVGTGAVFDEALFDEFRGTATSELHLDAWLADEGVFPNIDLELSHTRSADLLVEPDDLEAIDTLRRLMAAAVDEADGPPVEAARRLVERIEATKSNAEFLKEISNATSL